MLRTGDILLAEFPYSNQSGSKQRPVVLISRFREDLLVAYFTREVAKYADEITSVLISQEDIGRGKIRSTSIVRVHKLAAIEARLCKWVARLGKKKIDEILRKLAAIPTMAHFESIHKSNTSFVPGKSAIHYAGRVYDEKEMRNLVDASLDFWLTAGRYTERFERDFADFLGVNYSFLVSSGSSANLIAFMSLTSPLLEDRQIRRGAEVITVAAGFPTTVAPIIQYGAVPVFVDVDLETGNVDVRLLEHALSRKTKAVMLAHTLGNPFDIKAVSQFCKKHGLWLIEDNCDALGSTYDGRYTGTWGDMATSSFYAAHHMTMGEGGAVYTNDKFLKKIVLSMRDWGRDCWCASGKDNTCGSRFKGRHGTLSYGYDHKYVYSHFGYNLKPTDMQAAIGCAQLEKLPGFIDKRKENFQFLYDGLKDLQELFILPKAMPKSDPSWFGFLLTLRDGVKYKRNDIVTYLEEKNIQTRNLFAGNLTRHPCFSPLKEGKDYHIAGELKNTDKLMNDSFWIGVYPGMTEGMIKHMTHQIKAFVGLRRH